LVLDQNEIISLLDQAKYLYLRQISEPEENSLRLVVEEAIADRSATAPVPDQSTPFADILKDASPIRSTDKCKTFELRWTRYIAYLVTEEVAGSGGSYEEEIYAGNLFRVYTKSHFLDHLSRDTGGHPEPILHYKLICQNHLIDIASYNPPEVRLLSTGPESGGTKLRPN
jgi:hypothetical protein